MNKYKVVVYAISKNESSFVSRWVNSMSEADAIYVLDTGSTDDTVDKLKKLGVNVSTKIIKPWRFDKARNESLKLVPKDTDICVCTDLDEVFNPGWRRILEENWNNANKFKYIYNWSLDDNNKPQVTFWYEKIHDRKHYKWIYPVHEILSCNIKKERISSSEDLVLNHYPDKTKSRSSYLPLLELAVKENPHNDRMLHYLGREYMYYKMWNKSIDTLLKHINMNNIWELEKCASLRFISRCYIALNRYYEAEYYLKQAINTSPNIREPYVELAILYLKEKKYNDCINNCFIAKSIINKDKLYINEIFCYDSTIDDLLSVCFYYLGLKEESLFFVDKALSFNDKNYDRLQKNKEIFLK